MPNRSKPAKLGETQEFFLNLYAEVAYDLQIYCDVVGAQKTRLINRAVRELIDRDLAENSGFRERFEALKAQRIALETRGAKEGRPFRVVKGAQPTAAARRRRHRKRDH
jgi:hypothetical protein